MRDRDELDQLASDISQLAGKLENIEHNRRAFMADISHELRTPWPCSRPSWKPYRTAYARCAWTHWRRCSEVTQLNKLVDDLHELAVTQTGEFRYTFEALDLHRIAQHCAMTMQARAGQRPDPELLQQRPAPVHPGGRIAPAAAAVQPAGKLHPLYPPGRAIAGAGSRRRSRQAYQHLGRWPTQHRRLRPRRGRSRAPAPVRALLPRGCLAQPQQRRQRTGPVHLPQHRRITHGGEIAAHPSPLGGLRIVVRLPALVSPPPPPPLTAATDALVLVVEDEPRLAAVLCDYLRASGYRSEWIADGAQVMSAYAQRQHDLILLDVMLPHRDGISLCQELRAHSQVPIIMVTARVDEVDRLLGLQIGADDYVCKPFSPREVIARVGTVLRRYRQTPAPGRSRADRRTQLPRPAARAGAGPHAGGVPPALRPGLPPGAHLAARTAAEPPVPRPPRRHRPHVDSHIKNLRRKLTETGGQEDPIRSVYGVGYRLDLAV
jgi:two-component system response regulator BaeR